MVRVLTELVGPGSGLASGSDFRSGFLVWILGVAFWVRDLGWGFGFGVWSRVKVLGFGSGLDLGFRILVSS